MPCCTQNGEEIRTELCHFPDKMRSNSALMRRGAMLPEIDALPGAQRELAPADRDGKIDWRQSGANMRRHIVVPFGGMDKQRVAVRHQPGEEFLKIPADVRISIFLDEQRCRSVAHKQCQQPLLKTTLRNPAGHFLREL